MTPAALSGLDLLATAVVLVDAGLAVRYVNPAAENLFEASIKNVMGESLDKLFSDSAVLMAAIQYARANNCSYTEHDLELGMSRHARLHLSCTVTPVEISGGDPKREELLLEFRHIEQQLRIAREERMLDQSQANRELIRNLAHEIKNPLGGIRGAAQLLERELERPQPARIHAGDHEGSRPAAIADGPAADAAPPAAAGAAQPARGAGARAQPDPRGVSAGHRGRAATTT